MINTTCSLVLRDLYLYDIVSAFPTIMSRQFYDFKGVSLDDKAARNVFIGKEQANNIQLSTYLNESVKSLTNHYLRINEIKDDEIIFRQKDGFILTKKLAINKDFIEMKLRSMISLLIINTNRTGMIYWDDFGELSVKGVPHYYHELDSIYTKIYDFNFYDIKTLFKQMESLKNKILKPTNIKLYGVEKEKGQYTFMLKNNKAMRVRDLDFVNPKDIDTRKYFNFYFKPFFDSIYLEVTR